jgi:hypothetical protein
MGILAYFTHAISQYAPLSYGFSVAAGLAIGLLLLKLYNNVMTSKTTEEPTFIEYRMNNGRINLIKKSNIYKEPSVQLQDLTVINQPQPAENRAARRGKGQQAQVAEARNFKSAVITALFQRPLSSESIHFHIEEIGGGCPTREISSVDNRWASIAIANIADNCSFRIHFNYVPKD